MKNPFFTRFVKPYGLVIAIFLLVLTYAYSLSRIFLALTHEQTVVLAVLIAVFIFVAGFAFEKFTQLKQAHLAAIGISVFVALVGIAAIASNHIPTEGHGHEETAMVQRDSDS